MAKNINHYTIFLSEQASQNGKGSARTISWCAVPEEAVRAERTELPNGGMLI